MKTWTPNGSLLYAKAARGYEPCLFIEFRSMNKRLPDRLNAPSCLIFYTKYEDGRRTRKGWTNEEKELEDAKRVGNRREIDKAKESWELLTLQP